jgi:plastocyanin
MTRQGFTAAAVLVTLALVTSACGGGDDDPGTGPSGGGGGGGGGGTGNATATITITASGVSPKEVTVAPGSRVAFVNNDSRSHDMASNPHPTHGDCPAIEQGVGFIQTGQTKLTDNLNVARVCGYHDHNQPDVVALQGTIRIQ